MVKKIAAIALGFTVAAIIGVVFLPVVNSAVADSTGTQSVTNETVAADIGAHVDLSGFDIDENSVTVWGYNDTTNAYEQAVNGTDYEIAYQNGSLKALSGSSLIDDGEDVLVTYDYQASGSTTTLVAGFIPVMVAVLVFANLAYGVMDMM